MPNGMDEAGSHPFKAHYYFVYLFSTSSSHRVTSVSFETAWWKDLVLRNPDAIWNGPVSDTNQNVVAKNKILLTINKLGRMYSGRHNHSIEIIFKKNQIPNILTILLIVEWRNTISGLTFSIFCHAHIRFILNSDVDWMIHLLS